MMSKSQSNLKIISLDSEEEDSENEGSAPTERGGVDSPEVLTLLHSEEIPHQSRLCGDKTSEVCRTPEEEKQSQAIALPLENCTKWTPAVPKPWQESREQPLAFVKPFNKDNVEQLNTWQDIHTGKKQDPRSNEGNYHKQGQLAQVSRPEHRKFQFHFDKGQTRCYNNNRTLSNKVTDLKLEYLKDARDSRNADFNSREDEFECLQIEIVGEESCAKKYLAKLQQLGQEIWNGRLDLHKIVREASDIALMAHGLEKEFITMAEKCLSCGILVEKGSRRIKHFLSSLSHWEDDQLDDKSEIVRSMSFGCQESTDKLTIRNSTLHVVNTDITKYQANILVNFFDKKSGLSTRGVIFKNFMKHGGNKLFQYLQDAYSNTDNVMITESSGGLQCQYVCHVALPEYHEDASLQELRHVVQKCFDWSRTLEMHDIAFPFLGVGKMLNYPADRVTKLLISESISQVEQGGDWKISFVLFERENYSIFMQQLGLQQQKYHQGGSFHAPIMSHSEPDLRKKMYTPKSAQRGRGEDVRGRSATTDITVPDIQLFTVSRQEGENVRRELSRMIKEEYCHEQVIENVLIGELSKEKKKRMYTAGQNHEVSVFLDKDKNCVLLKGKAKNVSSAAREIGTLGSNESPTKSAATGSRENHHQRGITQSAATASRENHHQRGTTQSAATGSRENHHQRGTTQSPAKVRRENHHQRGTTPYWKEMLEEHPVPLYWKYFQDGKTFTDVFKSFFTTTEKHYDVDPKTFNAVSKLVEETFDSRLVGQGADAKNLHHRGIRVRKVEIIENLDLFKDYNMHRMRILGRSLKGRKFPPKVEKIPKRPGIQNIVEKGPIFTEKIISNRLKKDIYPELNEVYLFHGTKKEFVKNIMSKGMDPKCCSDDGMFGRGIYCSESSTKADQYADNKDQRGSEGRMFLMRLLLGHVYITESPKKFKQPPCSNCRQDNCVNPSHWRYDSVVGVKQQSGGLFREFVVYEKNQCYPEYLITYTRL